MKNGKRKGNKYENDIAKQLTQAWKMEFRRVPTSGGMAHWRGDIIPVFDEDRIRFPYCIELKNRKTISMPAWLRQTREEALEMKKIGILIFHRHNTSKDYAVLKESDFKNLFADQYCTIELEEHSGKNLPVMQWIEQMERGDGRFVLKFTFESEDYLLLPLKDFVSLNHSFHLV